MPEKSIIDPEGQRPVLRFAPSPNGPLHLGHALSAFLNADMATSSNGRLLLRIEDIDRSRCTPQFERDMVDVMDWLGLVFERPYRRQSEHFNDYATALDTLVARGLAYPAFMTRGEVKACVAAFEAGDEHWPRDPDGTPLYPDDDRARDPKERSQRIADGDPHAWRLDMKAALAAVRKPLFWREAGGGPERLVEADPGLWGDIVLSRSDAPSSYHLSVTVDDALQGVTHVVRGLDLYAATAVHRLLQHLLGLPEPVYHHHRLIMGADGRKLSKSEGASGLAALRAAGCLPVDIRRLAGL